MPLRTTLPALLLALLTVNLLAAPKLTPEDLAGKRIVILGDSITQSGTYVSFLNYYLLQGSPDLDFDLLSVGLGSETASGLSEDDHPFPRPCIHTRLDQVLAKTKPEVLFACYGMNDGIYHPASPARDKAYQDGILKLIEKAKAAGVETVVLLTPGTFEASAKKTVSEGPYSYKRPYAKYDEVLAGYSDWILSLSLPHVVAIDLHTPMATLAASKRAADPKFLLARDGIHPGALGHLVMAHAILSQLGHPTPNDLDAELARVTADPLYQLARQHRTTRSKGWLPYIGYTRGKTFQTDTIADTEAKATALMGEINTLRRK